MQQNEANLVNEDSYLYFMQLLLQVFLLGHNWNARLMSEIGLVRRAPAQEALLLSSI